MSLCVVNDSVGWLFLGNCNDSVGNNYIYDWKQHISVAKNCFSNTKVSYVYMYNCYIYERVPTQEFVWDPTTGRIVNRVSKRCMDVHFPTFNIFMAPCNISKTTQSFRFDNFNSTLVGEAWEMYRSELGFQLRA